MAARCPFCEVAQGNRPASLVHQDARTVVFLDHRPVFPGHCLVAPREHFETLLDLPQERMAELLAAAQLAARALEEALRCQGSFVAINNRVSQSVPHLHVHVVPRSKGDGLKGFFWPRHPYRDAAHEEETRQKIAGAIAALLPK